MKKKKENDLVYLERDHRLYMIQDYEVSWEHCEIIPLFLLFSHPWFLSFEVNNLSTTTKNAIFFWRFSRRVKANARGREERSGLLRRTAFFALLSLHASASCGLPLSAVTSFTSEVSMVTVVLVLLGHAIRQITRSKRLKTIRSKISQKNYCKRSQYSVINVFSRNIISIQAFRCDGN